MATEKATLEFEADTSNYDAGVARVEQSFGDLEKAVTGANRFFGKLFDEISGRFVITAGDIVNFGAKIASAIGSIPDLIQEGSGIDDLASSFDSLTRAAGGTGSAFSKELSAALSNTIPKVDLMKQANELMLGGLKPDQILTVAKAARTFGEVTGTNAAEGMNAFADSLLRGNDRALKTIGIVVDNEKAMQRYADSVGKATKDLSEQEKVDALRAASLQALAENTEKLGVVTDDAGDLVDQMTTKYKNQKDEIKQAIANNESLKTILEGVKQAFDNIDISDFAKDLITIAGGVALVTAKIGEFVSKGAAAIPVIKQTSLALSSLREVMDKGAFLIELFGADKDKKDALLFNRLLKDAGVITGDLRAEANALVPALDKVNEEVNKAGGGFKKTNQEGEKTKKFLEEYRKALEAQRKELTETVTKSDAYNDILADLKNGTLNNETAGKKLKDLYSTTKDNLDELRIETEIYNKLLDAQSRGLSVNAEDLAKSAQRVDELQKSLEGLNKEADKVSAPKDGGGFLDGILGQLGLGQSGSSSGAGWEAAGAQIGQEILNGLQLALSGDKLNKKETGEAIGSGVGAGIGAYFGGSQGAQIGSQIGNLLGGYIATGFGSRESTGKIRDSLDKAFADALKDNPLQAIINGQLSTIKDLNFFRGTDAFDTGAFDDVLQSLSFSAQQAFQGMAQGFSLAFGQGVDASGQLAAIIASNLGGSLNNLQLLVQSTGLSFDQMKEQVVEAFLDGKLSIEEAQSALSGIAQIATEGIPDGIGMVATAFDNIKAAGVKGGRALVDALKDVGFEAKELGDKTLEEVMKRLKATAGVSAEEVDQVFEALKSSGINTLDQLTGATVEQLLPALAKLSQNKFPFAEAAEDARKYVEAIDGIPEQKTVRLNLEVNYPNAADQRVVQDLAGRGQLGQGSAVQ